MLTIAFELRLSNAGPSEIYWDVIKLHNDTLLSWQHVYMGHLNVMLLQLDHCDVMSGHSGPLWRHQ